MKTPNEYFQILEKHADDPWSVEEYEFSEAMDALRDIADNATPERAIEVTGPHGWTCPHCGKRLRRNTHFCSLCGKTIDWG